ncbi:MAG TPA: kynureninase [bacterium]|nr:kynureninase [bacterium]
MNFENSVGFAQKLDQEDSLKEFRSRFHIPCHKDGTQSIYFCGNSLGLQPKSVRSYIEQELKDWETLGVEGHFHAKNPWMPYHEFLTAKAAKIVGANEHEVVHMNSLTTNLHLLMVSFYRPTKERHKILIEKTAFPSDQYAVQSQIRYHGYDPKTALVEIMPRDGEEILRTDDIEEYIQSHGHEIALILLGGVNYYTGQAMDMLRITAAGHNAGCVVGFDLAHAAGNIILSLHDWNVDFAAWCSYKYLNSGPGGISGIYIHENHTRNHNIPRFAGWWGHDKKTRFLMKPDFIPIPTAESWQLSNAPVLLMASLRASLDIFDEASMDRLRKKSLLLTGYLEYLIHDIKTDNFVLITPSDSSQRGCQISIQTKRNGKKLFEKLSEAGIIADWREPDVVRVAPVPLYNSFLDVYRFAEILKKHS